MANTFVTSVFKYKGMRRVVGALMESGYYMTLSLTERRDLAKRIFLAILEHR